MRPRICWLDVAKCFGIFAIYLGHYETGLASDFVFRYHVPFFFFLSGCTEYLNREDSVRISVKKVLRGLLIPWLFFCLLSVLVYVLDTDCEMYTLWPSVWKILLGTPRNSFVGFGLWFMTCLAVIKLTFALLRKIPRNWIIMLFCLAVHLVCVPFVNPSHPRIPFNGDAGMYYLLYYGIGYVTFPGLNRFLEDKGKGARLLCGVTFCASAAYCAYLYFGRNLMERLPLSGIIGQDLIKVLTALAAIWFQVVLSYVFRNVESLQNIGRNTLYLCGSEYPVRILQITLFGMVGFQTTVSGSLTNALFALMNMWVVMRFLVPAEKRMLKEVNSVLDFLAGLCRRKNSEKV